MRSRVWSVISVRWALTLRRPLPLRVSRTMSLGHFVIGSMKMVILIQVLTRRVA